MAKCAMNIGASTLPEAIVALAILLVCFTMAVTLIVSLTDESLSESEVYLHFKLTEFKEETLTQKRLHLISSWLIIRK